MWENIAGGEKILSPPWFQHCGGERPVAPAVPTPLVIRRAWIGTRPTQSVCQLRSVYMVLGPQHYTIT